MSVKKITMAAPAVVQDLLAPPDSNADTLRLQFGSWVSTQEGIQFVEDSENPDVILNNITDGLEKTKDMMLRIPSREFNTSLDYSNAISQEITLYENKDSGNTTSTTTESWREKLESIIPNGEQEYFVTSFEDPLTVEEVRNMEADAPGAPAGVNYVYNYYDPQYEEVLATVNDHEILFSLYSMFDASSYAGTDFVDINPFTGEERVKDVDVLPVLGGMNTSQVTLASKLEAYKADPTSRLKFKNQIVPLENMPLLADYEGSKYLYPMYVDINIPLDKNNEFAPLFRFFGAALTRDIEGITDTGISDPPPSVGTEDVVFSTSVVDASGQQTITNSQIPTKVTDLLEWTSEDAPAYAFDAGDPDGYPLPRDFYFIGAESGQFTSDLTYGWGDSITIATGQI